MEDVIITWLYQIGVAEIILGVILTLVVLVFIFKTIGLTAETQRLREKVDETIQLNHMLIRGMHQSGMIDAQFDREGKPTDWVVTSGKIYMLSGKEMNITGNVSAGTGEGEE